MRKLIYLLTAIGIISLSLSGCESEEEKQKKAMDEKQKRVMNSPSKLNFEGLGDVKLPPEYKDLKKK